MSNFVQEYAAAGHAPIPCARCNSDLKFATLAERAAGFGADLVATGHYAASRRTRRDDRVGCSWKRGSRPGKGPGVASLFSLTQEQLAHASFPVGDLSKDAVRLRSPFWDAVADKPDSQEICFVPDDDYATFVGKRAPGVMTAGAIVDEAGHRIGTHDGIHRFHYWATQGTLSRQLSRRFPALRAGTPARRSGSGCRPEDCLERTTLTASRVNWIVPIDGPRRISAQIRHRHRAAPGYVRPMGNDATRAEVLFDEPQLAITPGQAVVFYDGDVVVGGGWID